MNSSELAQQDLPADSLDVFAGFHFDPQGSDPIRAEVLGLERLEVHARQLGAATQRTNVEAGIPLLPLFAASSKSLGDSHRRIRQEFGKPGAFGSDAEWLLDNFHIISEALTEVRTDLPPNYYALLPKLSSGPWAGFPRVYAVAWHLVAHCDSSLDEQHITRFVQAYQDHAPLTIGEIWAVPIMLRVVLLDNLRRLASHILRVYEHCSAAKDWVVGPAADPAGPSTVPANCSDEFLFQIVECTRAGHLAPHLESEWLDRCLAARSLTVAEVMSRVKRRQAANQISIGNCVTSLRMLSALDWASFFERTSLVEAILRKDPAGIYASQDFATRDRSRRVVEQLARGSQRGETEVAEIVIDLAERPPSTSTANHVGYYLLAAGRAELEAAVGFRPPWKGSLRRAVLAAPQTAYFGGIGLLTLLVLALVAWSLGAAWVAYPVTAALLLALALLPASELAISMVHPWLTWLLPPRVLPKLLLKQGVPVEHATFVVIPSMLVRPQSAQVLLERLELHYLSNPDPNLRFALLTDFADAPEAEMPEDASYLQAAIDGVRAMNERYGGEQPRFFLFHRRRIWNPAQDRWMGWERKRGKLDEFNRLLRGAQDTSYATLTGDLSQLPRIRFVITLDADTQLPREAAQRLVATLAHPLNSPRFDSASGRVTAGYGVLQPRITLSLAGGSKSLFARIYAGSAGIDPYVTAVSDVYQDLFAAGSFTGKGIYDVDAFTAATGRTFPENQILSHDLIEGNYARCGLVTDIEFIDDYPTTYSVAARRDHRWVRGDWQIVSWLLPRVPLANGTSRENPLPLPERWKIFDNLRRSLLAPTNLALLILTWFLLPGQAWATTLLVVLSLAFPVATQVFWMPWRLLKRFSHRPEETPPSVVPESFESTAGQTLLRFVFLAETAALMVDAIGRTLVRLNITRKNLLEWETAATTERRLGTRFVDFCRLLWFSPVLTALVTVALLWFRPAMLAVAAPLLLAWLLAPAVAYWVSRPLPQEDKQLASDDRTYLRQIARKTWHFFEMYVQAGDHWLPPDNFQEDPKGAIAHRTSPTNMGLYLLSGVAAHDFGYVSLAALLYRLEQTFDTFDRLERFHGHLYNWYDTESLQPLQPAYISTVDSGNLLGCLVALEQGLAEKSRLPLVGPACRDGLRDTLALAEQALAAILPRDHAAAATPLANLKESLRAFTAQLENPPADLCRWQEQLEKLEKAGDELLQLARRSTVAIGVSPEELLRWAQQAMNQVRDRRAELSALAPWLEPLRAAPSEGLHPVTAGEPRSATCLLIERWERLFARLTEPASLVEVAALATTAREELQILAAQWPTHVGRHWFAEIGAAVERSTAGELLARCQRLAGRAGEMGRLMDFRFLYNEHRNLFAIGFNLSQGRLDTAHYDLLASEACLTSFLAIARGDVPKKHWFQLGRSCTRTQGAVALLSWGGTMFEYLMPRLLMRSFSNTLLAETYRAAVDRQIEYGRQSQVPWGISESAYSAVDADLNYQYQAFGVPGLGLKRGLANDLVVAPYATLLALQIRPLQAVENLRRLEDVGATGRFGFYEAIDYKAGRSSGQRRGVMVKCYMAHHQGMGLLALANCLLDEPLPRRFHSAPMVRATELLLQERVPHEVIPVQRPAEAAEVPLSGQEHLEMVSRRLTTPATVHPRTHLISSGQYTVMVTSAGGSRSMWRGLDVTRWREDRTCDPWGQFCYVRDLKSGLLWSAGHQPICREADEFEVTYSADKAELRRIDEGIETHWEITVSPENHAEIRRLVITNHNSRPHDLELTSYCELVLGPHRNDLAHPAFGKLFLETEFVPEEHALLCRRRPRAANEKPIWALHVLAVDGQTLGEVEYETDRERFLGRGNTPANPAALQPGASLSGTTGPVLDPIFSLRCRVRIPADSSVRLAFTTAAAETREAALTLADQYHDYQNVLRAFDLAWAHCQVELRQLHMTAQEAHLYQRIASHIVYAGSFLRAPAAVLESNQLGQSGLWKHSISGDNPIVLAAIDDEEHLPLARQLITAHSYWRLKGLVVDLVLLNEHQTTYQEDLHQQLQGLVRASDDPHRLDAPGGIFLRKATHMAEEDHVLLQTAARCVFFGSRGGLAPQFERLERTLRLVAEPPRSMASQPPSRDATPALPTPAETTFHNGIGGFTADGGEYILQFRGDRQPSQHDGSAPPAPWSNVVANPTFGFLVSESGAGFTWGGNSQMNRLTPWNNDPVSDLPGEVIYLRDEATREVWSPTPAPFNSPAAYRVRHGQGYSVFEHASHGLSHELLLFVPADDPLKLIRLTLKNTGQQTRSLSATFFAEWVLGTVRDNAPMQVITELDEETGALLARNPYSADYPTRISFADVDRRPYEWTADRTEFLGRNGGVGAPAALARDGLDAICGAGLDPCAAVQALLTLEPGEEQQVVFVLGQADSIEQVRSLLAKYREPGRVEQALQEVREGWNRRLATVQVRTPNPALDLLVNRWLVYQVHACRVWGRSGFYQSSGAYGFRDQLQDVMALVYSAPQETRAHILRAAAHQFREGDVQHWWHPPSGAGVRTRISDDYLWLPLVVCHYLNVTGDRTILQEQVPFLNSPPLKAEQEEDYRIPEISLTTASIYDHCLASIQNGLRFGEHGLPLMGSGDWNDGMNRVGDEGRGESVWNGWFLLTVLEQFAEVVEAAGDAPRAADYRQQAERLRLALEEHAWDGAWYRRAYFDDGTPLGSAQNQECQIDSLPQTWALISGAGDSGRTRQAMQALEERLVLDQQRLILLFSPPFDKGGLNPGYIKGYVPGIRENGGQYTHAAAWCVWATALQGRGTRAVELFDLLNPILHTDTPDKVREYRTEPYVLAGDVYGAPPHTRRGGWTWYTGSASWLYRVALEAILGFELRGKRLTIAPTIPSHWPGFEITYRFGSTTYEIEVQNPRGVERGVCSAQVDGQAVAVGPLELVDDGQSHRVRIVLGCCETSCPEVSPGSAAC